MTPNQIAEVFREARLTASPLGVYPDAAIPEDLDSAYRIQTIAISSWPGPIGGWKVAAIQPQWRERYPAERLAGPVFAANVWDGSQPVVRLPVIPGGYAAVEVEFMLRIGKPLPSGTRFDDAQALREYVDRVHAGIELAASPLAGLSALGPGAVISDFGNNGGIIVGPELSGFFDKPADTWDTRIELNGQPAGDGNAARVPGGVLEALRFLANHLAERGIGLNTGDWISTGATTGIHAVEVGDTFIARFGDHATIHGEIAPALALLNEAREPHRS